MTKTLLGVVEVLLLFAVLGVAIQWVLDPNGPHEERIALTTAVLAIVDIGRRTLRSSRLRVFLSVGATYTDEQEVFVTAFERLLESNRCEVMMVGRSQQSALQPIQQVRNLMRRSEAVVVLAFTRHYIKKAIEKPGARNAGQTRKWGKRKLPTVWNQIEAGIGFGLGRPLLVFVESGLHEEAMLKDRHEFRTLIRPLHPNPCDDPTVKERVTDFLRIARRRSWLRL